MFTDALKGDRMVVGEGRGVVVLAKFHEEHEIPWCVCGRVYARMCGLIIVSVGRDFCGGCLWVCGYVFMGV